MASPRKRLVGILQSKVDYSSNEWPELFAEYNEYEKGYDDGKTDGWNDCIDAMNGE